MSKPVLDDSLKTLVEIVDSFYPSYASVGIIREKYAKRTGDWRSDGWLLRRLIHLIRLGEIDVRTIYRNRQIQVQFWKKVEKT
jgi:hypothetical protein